MSAKKDVQHGAHDCACSHQLALLFFICILQVLLALTRPTGGLSFLSADVSSDYMPRVIFTSIAGGLDY